MQFDGRAKELFLQAWHAAVNDFEKFTAAHYVARHQPTTADNGIVKLYLQWIDCVQYKTTLKAAQMLHCMLIY